MLMVVYGPHFVAGVVFEHGRIERTAPIIAWMKKQNWTWDDIRDHCNSNKGWSYTTIYEVDHE